MRRRRVRSKESPPQLMLSPMIDMVFICLVFFIVSTMYMTDLRMIPIHLPKSEHSEMVTKSNFAVTVKKDGDLYLGSEKITMEALLINVETELQGNASFSVIIRAENDAPYESVIMLLDRLKSIGVTRFGLATDMGDTDETGN